MGEAHFNQFMRLTNQLVIASENFAREENLSALLTPTMSQDMDEQLRLAQKVVDVMDRANGKICVTPLRYSLDKLENFYARVRLFARKKQVEKFQQIVNVKKKHVKLIYLLDLLNLVYVIVIAYKPKNQFVMSYKK